MVNVTITLEIEAFEVPDHVVTVNTAEKPGQAVPRGHARMLKQPMKYPLDSLDAEALSDLCEDFTAAVFKKAGVQRPPTNPGP